MQSKVESSLLSAVAAGATVATRRDTPTRSPLSGLRNRSQRISSTGYEPTVT